MSKIDLTAVSSGFNSNTTMTANFEALETELQDKVLYRDNPSGEPNSMQQDLDMNGFEVLNALASSGEGFSWRGDWAPTSVYVTNNLVYVTGGTYEGYTMIARDSFTSDADFDTDFSLSRWAILAKKGDMGASGTGSGDLVSTNNLDDITNADTARTNLGLVIGTDVEGYDATLAKTGQVNTYSKAQRGAIVVLTDAAPVAVDLSLSNNFSLLMTSGVGSTRTLQNPTNVVAGQSGIIEIAQDSIGNRLLTYGTEYEFEGGSPFVLSTAADAIDQIAYYVAATGRITLSIKANVFRV